LILNDNASDLNVMNLKCIQKNSDDFFEKMERLVNALSGNDGLPSRLELTAKVPLTDGYLTKEAVNDTKLNLVFDLLQSKKSWKGYLLKDVIDKIKFSYYGLHGRVKALLILAGDPNSTNLPSTEKYVQIFNGLYELNIAIKNFRSGRTKLNCSSSYAPSLGYFVGRIIADPFATGSQQVLTNLVGNTRYNGILEKLGLQIQSGIATKALEEGKKYLANPTKIMSFLKSKRPHCATEGTVCLTCCCLIKFDRSKAAHEEYQAEHKIFCFDADIVPLRSSRALLFVDEMKSLLTKDQEQVFDFGIRNYEATFRLILVAAAGCGKSFTMKLLMLALALMRNPNFALITAPLNTISEKNGGCTVHRLFKLGCLEPHLVGRLLMDGDVVKKENVQMHILNSFKVVADLQQFVDAEILFLDEVCLDLLTPTLTLTLTLP
jgi:hypothetical protein